MVDLSELPGCEPTDLFRRKCAEIAEREMTWCIVCLAEGTIVLRSVGQGMILVCRGCGSIYDPNYKGLASSLWFVKVKSVGNIQDKHHLVGHEYRFPLDRKTVNEDRERTIPGSPPTSGGDIKEEEIVRKELKRCPLCLGDDTLRMRKFGIQSKLVCTNCDARFTPFFTITGSRFKTFKVVSVGNSGAPITWTGRRYVMPVNPDLIQEDIVHDLPGDPPSIGDDFKLEALIESDVHGCMICGHYGTMRFRRIKHGSRLVCRDCHSIYQPVTDLRVRKLSKLIIKSTGKLKDKPGVGTYIDLEDMKKSKGWRKAQFPPIQPVNGSTHGSHWYTVLGDRSREDLFRAQSGTKAHIMSKHVWRGRNIEHDRIIDNEILGVSTLQDDVRIMRVDVNKSLWTSYPNSYHLSEVDAVIDKVSLWPIMIEGWLHFNLDLGGKSHAALCGFDPLFFIHKGKIEKTGKLGLIGFAYSANIGEDHEIINERTMNDRVAFPQGKAVINQDSGWFMPLGFMDPTKGFNPDDYQVRMKVIERTDIDIFGIPGYLFKGKPFGIECKVTFPIIARKEIFRGEAPDVGRSLVADIWLQACSKGSKTNGLDMEG